MGIPINGGDPVHWIAHPNCPPREIITRAKAAYFERVETVRDRLKQMRETLGLPKFEEFLLTHSRGKVDNLEMVYHSGPDRKKVSDQIDAVKGTHGIKFRKKTDAYKQFLVAMKDCPEKESWGDALLDELCDAIGQPRGNHAWGCPALLEHPDGRAVLSIGLSMDMNGWDKKLDAAGLDRITEAEYLRFKADVLETEAKVASADLRRETT